MAGTRLKASFIVRVIKRDDTERIVVHDVHRGQSREFTSWRLATDALRALSRREGKGLR